MLKIGLFGVGHLGKIHLRLIKELSKQYRLIGFHDPNQALASSISMDFNVPSFKDANQLIQAVDVVDIVCPTPQHYDIATKAVQAGKHIFVEKPLTQTVIQAQNLVRMVAEKGVKAQVGHVERFNPAFLSIKEIELKPMFVETHRLAKFNPRGTDVSVVLDLMIHDIDILLTLVKADVKEVRANGVSVVSKSHDIANARVEFTNGCVANLTASRLSLKNMRKTRVFQPNAYISIDFLNKESQLIKLSEEKPMLLPSFELSLGEEAAKKYIVFNNLKSENTNAIKTELELFAACIRDNTPEIVPIIDGLKSMQLAQQILDIIDHE